MTNIIHAIILGIIQGLTEFLPISSSAHLNLFPWVFGWEKISESFDVALHLGTLLAIGIFFYKDWVNLIIGGYNQVIKKKHTRNRKNILVHSICYNPSRYFKFNFRQNCRKAYRRQLKCRNANYSNNTNCNGNYFIYSRQKS